MVLISRIFWAAITLVVDVDELKSLKGEINEKIWTDMKLTKDANHCFIITLSHFWGSKLA